MRYVVDIGRFSHSAVVHNPHMSETNFERAFTPRPDVYRAWQQLNGAIKAEMDPRRYELATLAAARSTTCRRT